MDKEELKEKDPALSVVKKLLKYPDFFKKGKEEQWRIAKNMFKDERKK